jgi:predicted esterase
MLNKYILSSRDNVTEGNKIARMKVRQIYLFILAVLVVCIFPFLIHSQAKQPEKPDKLDDKRLAELVVNLLNTRDEAEQNKIIESLLSAQPSIDKIEDLLKNGRKYDSNVKTGWQIAENSCLDGKERPYHFYIPVNYKPAKKYPLIIYLHGGVGSSQLIPNEYIKNMYDLWAAPNQEEEFIYVIPITNQGAKWWTEAGAYHIIDSIEKIKEKYNVDENRIYVSGFSDGGSGVYYLAFYHNTNFAGFISLNGFLPVAQAGEQPVYLPNLRNKSIYIVNTGKDQLYPIDEIKACIEGMKKADVPITFKDYPDIGHRLEYWDQEKPALLDFMEQNIRKSLPSKLSWETVATELGRVHWLQINEIKDIKNNANLPDYNVMLTPQRVRLGISLDPEYKGERAKVQDVEKNSLAEKLNIQKGDIICQVDDKEINQVQDLLQIMGTKKPGDSISLKIKRGDNTHTQVIEGQFGKNNELQPVLRRDKISGRIEVVATKNKIETKVKNISRYTIFISKDQFDINKEVEIYTNDELSFKGKVKPDLKFMLEQAGKDKDKTMVFYGKIDIEVKHKERFIK